ncbi:MAG: hypothetical protein AAFX87_12775 [Bacteroidota bacterium]
MHWSKRLGLLFILTIAAAQVFGQASRTPFSAIGIGDIIPPSLINSRGMGGIGVSNPTIFHLNNQNPALLPFNRLTVFEIGIVGESRTINSADVTETGGSGNLNYMATAFPLGLNKLSQKRASTISLALQPYSFVNYRLDYTEQVTGSDVETDVTEQGTGGFNQFALGYGIRLHKNFSVGAKLSYVFGSINNEFSNRLTGLNVPVLFTPSIRRRDTASDIMLSGGLAYHQDSLFSNKKISLHAGITYDNPVDLNVNRFESFERLIGTRLNDVDTLTNELSGSLSIPGSIAFGVSLRNNLRWSAGVDVRLQNWSEYTNFIGEAGELGDQFRLSLGGEFTPDPSSVSSYFKRVTYRAGFNYEQTPLIINNNQVSEIGINFGFSLPVSRFSNLNMAVQYSQRGDIQETIIEENIVRFYFGVTFNDRWFIKRKFD